MRVANKKILISPGTLYSKSGETQTLEKPSKKPDQSNFKTDSKQKNKEYQIVKGETTHKNLNPFFQWFNGSDQITKENKSTGFAIATNGLPMKFAKALWPLYLPLQIVGLVNERFGKLARAFYGLCWSIVYTGYRPWAKDRDLLSKENAPNPEKITKGVEGIYKTNEAFRMIMGTAVSAVYGGGALGMLTGVLKNDDDLFDRAANTYQTGMLNQNQIFASMNFSLVMKRMFNPNQLNEVDKSNNDIKSRFESIDSILFLPNIVTRAFGTAELFGVQVNENISKLERALGYFSYGTWAGRFGIMKKAEKQGGDLEPVKSSFHGNIKKTDTILHDTQQYGAWIFSTSLPVISWIAGIGELIGFRDFASYTFKLEGILERLNPTIASWCIRDTWLKALSNRNNSK